MWLLINNTLEKIDYFKSRTIHLLLRYTKCIDLDLGKALKISSDLRVIFTDLRRLSEVFGGPSEVFRNLRKCLGDLRKSLEIFWDIRKHSSDLRKSSEGFVRSSDFFGRFCTIFGGLRNVSVGLRQSFRFNFGNLHCNLVCVTLFCTVLTKNALLFSQSELSNFFKCIISILMLFFYSHRFLHKLPFFVCKNPGQIN